MQRKTFSARDRQIGKLLRRPDVDEVTADQHIARECEAIQMRWTDAQRLRATVTKVPPVEITVIAMSEARQCRAAMNS